MSDPYLAEVRLGAWNFAPRGWAMCSGQVLPISQNIALFSLVGTYYGGNGTSSFALPDLRGRAIMGMGPSDPLGEVQGTESVTVLTTQLPLHAHLVQAEGTEQAVGLPAGHYLGVPTPNANTNGQIYAPPGTLQSLNPAAVGNYGGNAAHENRQPFLAMTYVIALQGIFPPRS